MVRRSRKRGGSIFKRKRSKKRSARLISSRNNFQRAMNKNKIPKEYLMKNMSNNYISSNDCKWYAKQFDLLMKENQELKNKVEQQSFDLMYLREYVSKWSKMIINSIIDFNFILIVF